MIEWAVALTRHHGVQHTAPMAAVRRLYKILAETGCFIALRQTNGSSQKFANTFLRSCRHGCVKNSTQAHYACVFCLALTTAAVKSLFTNFRDDPLGFIDKPGVVVIISSAIGKKRQHYKTAALKQAFVFLLPQ